MYVRGREVVPITSVPAYSGEGMSEESSVGGEKWRPVQWQNCCHARRDVNQWPHNFHSAGANRVLTTMRRHSQGDCASSLAGRWWVSSRDQQSTLIIREVTSCDIQKPLTNGRVQELVHIYGPAGLTPMTYNIGVFTPISSRKGTVTRGNGLLSFWCLRMRVGE